MVDTEVFNNGLLDFLDASPTPFHAVATMARQLDAAGFTRLSELDNWSLQAGGRYYVTRNASSLVAFVYGGADLAGSGWRLFGAHTDSPCLKLKPQPEIRNKGYFQLGVEVYGGVLLNPWFDRDLSIAGRVNYLAGERLCHALVDLRRPVAVIPSLAIHLDREVNNNRSINAQKDLPPLLMLGAESKPDIRALLLEQLHAQGVAEATDVLDFELSLYDTQKASLLGWNHEFIASARLDNLLSCFVGLQALLAAGTTQHAVLVCNDHEEVGSLSAAGAQGPFLRAVLERIAQNAGGGDVLRRALAHSLLLSADNAHGVHPNFADKHDNNHGPLLNAGPVIKVNANQRYASNSETAGVFRQLCRRCEVPVQSFVVRSDMACGSTIGPITAAELGVATVDVGVPTFAMHSIRELAGSEDAASLCKVATALFELPSLPWV